jgi:hypothetical protein
MFTDYLFREGNFREGSVSSTIALSVAERELLGALVNNINVFGAEMISHTHSTLREAALTNIAKMKQEHEPLLKRLDGLARAQGDESPLRLIEDFPLPCRDLAKLLTLVRRCLLASAFLGHLIAQPIGVSVTPTEIAKSNEARRLH